MTSGQMRMIFALARNAGIDNDELHDMIYGLVQKESIVSLSAQEAARVIDRLKQITGTGAISGDIPNRATQKQQWLIRRIEKELGWNGEPGRLRGMIRRMTGADDMRFLTIDQARKVIETLKEMQKGGRGERRMNANGGLDG